nr:delta(24)-sterol reductase [Quercus suber]
MEEHDAAVQAISQRVRGFYQQQIPFRLYHGATNSTQARKVDPTRMIDTSKLNHVLKVDKTAQTCLVEPNVPMDQLVDELLPHGLVPLVVMEFPGITVGGGFAGSAGESSGFKHGFFETTISWIEIVLPTGEVVHASATERADLFAGAAGTYGTLGVTTLLELRLMPAQPYVHLTYLPTEDAADTLETMDAATQDASNDYVDAILLSATRGVVIVGKLSPRLPTLPIQRFTRAHDPWFYVHADRATRQRLQPVTLLTPLRDYLFRYDRGAFWTGRYAFSYFLTPFNRLTRWLLDPLLRTRAMYRALHFSALAQQYFVQDLLVPRAAAEDLLDFVHREHALYPLWLCPFTTSRPLSLRPRALATAPQQDQPQHFVNVGVWGPGPRRYDSFVAANRALESHVASLHGIKCLYAQAYYTATEFARIYDLDWYQQLRDRYHAGYLPDVFEKVCVKFPAAAGADVEGEGKRGWGGWVKGMAWNTWPVRGVYGVLKTLYEREYLLDHHDGEKKKR